MEQRTRGTIADIHVGRCGSYVTLPLAKLAYTELRPINFIPSGLGVPRRSRRRV